MATLYCAVLIFSFVLTGAQQEEPCEAEKCPQYGPTEVEPVLTLLPVPWNCSQYVACDRGIQMFRPCPLGLHFNAVLMVCDYPDHANCVERCTSPT
ncbi:conserved hypothetical protein [Culex quinquefasciatus]|uniref:Chitin-binding type-2 domain-containing protein n=1 Tax=Culex quinquefasciatus TaxID=7176 RepID=B0WNC1_CULQU|nr:conserved hypothetical protein [Culex quinquefasciatus]|eukprot:XP_001850205.1 conserved hypothetical protein [Culex quinquefasciatus]